MACANCAFCEYTEGCLNISFWGLPTNSVHVLRAINLGLEQRELPLHLCACTIDCGQTDPDRRVSQLSYRRGAGACPVLEARKGVLY